MDYDEYAEEEWVEDDGNPEEDVLICPSCKRSVHEDTQQCPHCGDWIIPVWPKRKAKRLIWVIAAGLVILAFILMAIF